MASGLEVPTDRALTDLTAELTTMLGSPDPAQRDGIAFPLLATWIERGVYDDLLPGLGDGMTAGLTVGLGEQGCDTVFRRSFSALVLAQIITRDTEHGLVSAGQVLRWGDHLMSWLLREKDLRGFVTQKGWAHALAHGADALGALAASPHCRIHELTVILDVIADRVLVRGQRFTAGEDDRLALATLEVLHRGTVPLSVVEPWIARIVAEATARTPEGTDPGDHQAAPEAFLRALHLQLALGPRKPPLRADLLLAVVAALSRTNAAYLPAP